MKSEQEEEEKERRERILWMGMFYGLFSAFILSYYYTQEIVFAISALASLDEFMFLTISAIKKKRSKN